MFERAIAAEQMDARPELWAGAVARVVLGSSEPSSVSGWSRLLGVPTGELKAWCESIQTDPPQALDFARELRWKLRPAVAPRHSPVVPLVYSGLRRTARPRRRLHTPTHRGSITEYLDHQSHVSRAAALRAVLALVIDDRASRF